MCPQDACGRDGSTFAVWTRWAEDSAEGKRHQKSTYTDVYGLSDGPQKRLYISIYILYIYIYIIPFSLSLHIYVYIYIYIFGVSTSKIGICHPNSEYLTPSDLVNLQLVHLHLSTENSPHGWQMMMTPCWGSPGPRESYRIEGREAEGDPFFLLETTMFIVFFRFQLLIFQGSTSCN